MTTSANKENNNYNSGTPFGTTQNQIVVIPTATKQLAITSANTNNRLQHQPDGNNITIHHITKQHGNNTSQTKPRLQNPMAIWQ